MKFEKDKKRRLFYDVETTHEFPQYCDLTLVGILEEIEQYNVSGKKFIEDKFHIWEAPFTEEKKAEIALIIQDPTVEERVGFNCLNFDDLVLANHGIEVPAIRTQDAMLAIKTCYPGLPSHALKFLSLFMLGDPHWAEFELLQTGHKWGDKVSPELKAYHRHDLIQHRAIWDWIKLVVQKKEHWEAYQLDMRMKEPLQEMTFVGGVYVDVKRAERTLIELEAAKIEINKRVEKLTNGAVKNANSTKQIGKYLDKVEDWALELTKTGEFQVKKSDLADITGMSEEDMRKWKPGDKVPDSFSSVALLAWQMKDNENLRKYAKNYYTAAIETNQKGWIPASYGISRAITRRTLSKSFYKINFQNSTEEIDEFKLIPKGYLGWFIDSTQIENVVHIYESGDTDRRRAYEADENWNEYVWLANRILNLDATKKELDEIPSKRIGHWSVYKEYKTAKLSLNFGQGTRAFSQKLGLDISAGKATFNDIHRACPAIRQLQDKVEKLLAKQGYVQDCFGHIYTGEEAYKVVAYLVQGCGTGSLPKAQVRANWETLQWYSQLEEIPVGCLMTTTHDENGGLLRLDLGETKIHQILCDLMDNMTKKFSHKFWGIPLRAKLYLTTTNWKDRKNHEQPNPYETIEIP